MSSYRRPKHHTYDYNFKVGESSYRDMLDYLDRKEGRRAASPPPGKRTFAERFAERPIYGELPPLQLYQSEPAERWPAPRSSDTERRPRFADGDDFLSGRPRLALDDSARDMDPEELIASIRRNRVRLDLAALDADADAEEAAILRRPFRLAADEKEAAEVGGRTTNASSRSLASSMRSSSVSKQITSSRSAGRSARYE